MISKGQWQGYLSGAKPPWKMAGVSPQKMAGQGLGLGKVPRGCAVIWGLGCLDTAHSGARDLLEQILLRRCLICPVTDRSDAMASLSTLVVLAEPQLMVIPGGKGLLE